MKLQEKLMSKDKSEGDAMTSYEELLQTAYNQGIQVIDYEFEGNMSGYYCNNVIFIDKNAQDDQERKCILVEELGHHFTAVGDLTGEDTIEKCKQEQLGRRWGFDTILPIDEIVDAVIDGCDNFYSIAEYLDITTEYLHEALRYYSQKYGPEAEYGDYLVIFSEESLIVHPMLVDII